jgi:hypothetical protein
MEGISSIQSLTLSGLVKHRSRFWIVLSSLTRSPLRFRPTERWTGIEQPEDNLVVEIWDPNGETLTCDVNTVMRSEPGGVVAGATIGGRQQFRLSPHVGRSWMRVTEGSGGITFDGTGIDLSPSARFSVKASGGSQCNQQSLRVRVLDLMHMRITLGADCLRKPGSLLVTTSNDSGESAPPIDFFEGAAVHVASKSSPTLTSVSPSTLPDNLRQDKMRLVLHGRGFTKDSVVYAGYYPDANDFQLDQLWPETEFVSPTELRVHVDPAHAGEDTVAQPQGEKLRLWVKGNEEKFELSQPYDVTLIPTGQPLPQGRLFESDFRRWKPKTAVITSVSPFPIRLMDEHSPKELEVSIRGDNFSPQDKVRFLFGYNANNDKEVRSEYISETMLRAWLPRQFWRKHAVSYRLVVETKEGKLLTRQVNEKDEH